MSDLNFSWTPEFGTIYTWIAKDKKGQIAVMVNNNWGDIPKVILRLNNVESHLDDLNEFIWEESLKYNKFPENKKGKTVLDLYSYSVYKSFSDKVEVSSWIDSRSNYIQGIREYSLPSIKGVYIYHAVEGNKEGEDFPVGYDGLTKMGDYFRYLVPTVFGGIHDFPKELWSAIAVSDTLDFTVDRVLDNNKINDYFTYCADEVKEFDQ